MRSPHSSDNSCRTTIAGFPHLPLQVACLEVVEVPLPAAGAASPPHRPLQAACRIVVEVPRSSRGASARCRSYLVGAPADVSACRSPRRAAGPPPQPLQAACLVVDEVPQPADCLGRVCRPADRRRSPAWPSFNELFLQMICKFEGRCLLPAGPDCVQFEAALF